jgi:hypothetical protein
MFTYNPSEGPFVRPNGVAPFLSDHMHTQRSQMKEHDGFRGRGFIYRRQGGVLRHQKHPDINVYPPSSWLLPPWGSKIRGQSSTREHTPAIFGTAHSSPMPGLRASGLPTPQIHFCEFLT